MDDSRAVGGDAVGATVDGSGAVVVGKDNAQTLTNHNDGQGGRGNVQVNVRDEQQRGQMDDTRYSILRMESKLDRLGEQVLSLTQQIPIQAQQMAQMAQQQAQMSQQIAQMAQQSATNDQRLFRLEQQNVQAQQHAGQQASTPVPRLDAMLLLIFAAALVLLFLWNAGVRP